MSRDALAALIEVRNRMHTDQSVEARSGAAQHLGSLFSSGDLAAPERDIALAIFEQLARDVARQVRQSLSAQIARCPFVPPALARTIAADVDAVSIPFIQASPALDDDDLLAVIASGSAAKQVAIASREVVSETLTEALVATHDAGVVAAVLQNPGAAVTEPSYYEIIDHFAADNMVQSLLVDRPWLPLGVTERLVQVVSDVLRDRLVEKHALPADLAAELADLAGERTLLADAAALPDAFDVEMLAARLNGKGKLTPTLLMRALCQGDARFFDVSIAMLAGIPPDNAATLIADQGPLGWSSLYEQTGLPPEFFKAFRAALDVRLEAVAESPRGGDRDRVKAILERVSRDYGVTRPVGLEDLLGRMLRGTLGRSGRGSH